MRGALNRGRLKVPMTCATPRHQKNLINEIYDKTN